MTRINLIPVQKLSDQHLLAEHREITRIATLVKKPNANLKNIPEKFCLGTGHVRFFYNKGFWLAARYIRLRDECEMRGFKVANKVGSFITWPDGLFGSWLPSNDDILLSNSRILSKIAQKPDFYRWTKPKTTNEVGQ